LCFVQVIYVASEEEMCQNNSNKWNYIKTRSSFRIICFRPFSIITHYTNKLLFIGQITSHINLFVRESRVCEKVLKTFHLDNKIQWNKLTLSISSRVGKLVMKMDHFRDFHSTCGYEHFLVHLFFIVANAAHENKMRQD
jgi:hypothetical protein